MNRIRIYTETAERLILFIAASEIWWWHSIVITALYISYDRFPAFEHFFIWRRLVAWFIYTLLLKVLLWVIKSMRTQMNFKRGAMRWSRRPLVLYYNSWKAYHLTQHHHWAIASSVQSCNLIEGNTARLTCINAIKYQRNEPSIHQSINPFQSSTVISLVLNL